MNHAPVVIALVLLVVLLSAIGAWTRDNVVLTMAASALTGLFAFLQVRIGKEGQ